MFNRLGGIMQNKEASLSDDITSINIMYLMFARDLAKNHPLESIWVLGLTIEQVNFISQLTPTQINDIARCGRSLMRVKIPEMKNGIGLGEMTMLMEAGDGA